MKSQPEDHNHSTNRKAISKKLLELLLTRAEREAIPNVIEIVAFKQGVEIYHTGKNSRHIYCLKSGLVKLLLPNEWGKESMVRLVGNFEFFGVLSLIENYRYARNAITMKDTEVYKIKREFFMSALERDIKISTLFSHFLLETLFMAEMKLVDFMNKTVDQRLADLLLSHFTVENEELVIGLTKKDIALMTGSIQETISRKLAHFSQEGFIKLRGRKIILLNIQALQALNR